MSSDCAQPHMRNVFWRAQGLDKRQLRSRARLPVERTHTEWDAGFFIGQPGYACRLSGPIIGSDRYADGRLKSAPEAGSRIRRSDPGRIKEWDSVSHRYGAERCYAPFRQPTRFGVPLVALGRGARTWTPSSQSASRRSSGTVTRVPPLALPPRR